MRLPPLSFVGKLKWQDGQVGMCARIARPHFGQIRFVRKRSIRRDTIMIPKKRMMRKVTSQKPIDTLSLSVFYVCGWKRYQLFFQFPQLREVDRVHSFHLWCFNDEWRFVKSGVVEDIDKCACADVPVADVFMSVNAALIF